MVNKKGFFEVAHGGTVFLDEVGELPLPLQVKLLRVLQGKSFTPRGRRTEELKVDVRIISATNKDLEEAVKEKHFREDLFYRLNVILIKLPPLRDRKEDIQILANHFLKKYSQVLSKSILRISPDAHQILLNYDYPGNERELQNIIERAVALESSQELTLNNLSSYLNEQPFLKEGPIDIEIPSEGIDLEKIIFRAPI